MFKASRFADLAGQQQICSSFGWYSLHRPASLGQLASSRAISVSRICLCSAFDMDKFYLRSSTGLFIMDTCLCSQVGVTVYSIPCPNCTDPMTLVASAPRKTLFSQAIRLERTLRSDLGRGDWPIHILATELRAFRLPNRMTIADWPRAIAFEGEVHKCARPGAHCADTLASLPVK